MAGIREDAESGPAGLTLATSKVGDWANAIEAKRNAACLMRSASTHYVPIFYNQFVPETNIVVAAATTTPKLQDGVIAATQIAPSHEAGCTVFVHYNGPTDQLRGMCAGMATLEPGASPHPPHRHPEEEILIVSDGTGIIECDGKVTEVGPGAMMYCAGNTLHGITNTGKSQMTFYWSKWLANGASA
jgi:quercetin dioxygenase-like cupin family protein